MSSRLAAAGVVVVTAALVSGGLYFALGDSRSGSADSDGERVVATRPTVVAATTEEVTVDSVADTTATTDTAVPPDVVEQTDSTEPPPASTVATAVPDSDATFPVANVVGQNQAIAESRLANFEVDVTVVDATSEDDFDLITAQSPLPGERLPAGGVVSLELSMQPMPETVEAERVNLLAFDIVDRAAVIALVDGQCALLGESDVVDPDGQRVLGFEAIDCDEPHDAQMITTIQLQGGPDEFEIDAVTEALRRECRPFFEEFVGIADFESNVFGLFTIRPEPDRYDNEGDRTAFCLVLVTDDVRVIGSAEDSLW